MPEAAPVRADQDAELRSKIERALDQGYCASCSRLNDWPSNCTHVDCDSSGCRYREPTREEQVSALLATLRAERDKFRSELATAVIQAAEHARARGEAEGRLLASEMAGVVEGWREQNERLAADLREAREERDDLQAAFDLRWKADMRAIERWHAAGGHKLTWPDHADLVVWLVTQWLGEPGAEAERIPSFGFARGTVVREATDGPNMLVVRGLGETTAVIVIEGDEGGKVRLRERPTAALRQVLAAGDYAEVKQSRTDWDPPALTPNPHQAAGSASGKEETDASGS